MKLYRVVIFRLVIIYIIISLVSLNFTVLNCKYEPNYGSNYIWQYGLCDWGLKEHLYIRSMEADVGRFCSFALPVYYY